MILLPWKHGIFVSAAGMKAMLVASFRGLIGEIEAGRKNPEMITQGLMWMFFLSAGGNYNYFHMTRVSI